MARLVGIDKGHVMDWTNDSGLDECYRKWKKRVEVLFKGPLSTANDGVKCNYIIYWSGDYGMDLVDKWETENKINDGNRTNIQTYWDLFEGYIHPQTNQLLAVMELKHLFQGSMMLKDFHTKALCLVKQAGYEGATKEKVLRDTIISGIASEKIRAKVVKEGHKVTLNCVMEIARLEISTQHHLDRMQETTKVNYVQFGKSTKNKKGRSPHTQEQVGAVTRVIEAMEQVLNPVVRVGSFHSCKTLVTGVEKAGTRKLKNARLWMLSVKVAAQRGILRKSVLNLNVPPIH